MNWNDLGINMTEYGSDYLLGLATFAPDKFAVRDRLWESGDPAYYALSDALQHLGNIRDPVPAYKTFGGGVLASRGTNTKQPPHPQCPRRPPWRLKYFATVRGGCSARTSRRSDVFPADS
jgi:4-hydroxy-tetrahydrodipicolinate synthase